MNKYILSLDQGTTNTKALLVGEDGRPHRRVSAAVPLRHPRAGFAEQDPEEIWASVEEVIASCLNALDARPAGVTITNQRETALAWDRASGRPLSAAISWQCRRSQGVCTRLLGKAPLIRERSGLLLDPLLSATKWAWLMEEDSTLAARAQSGSVCFGTVDSWLLYKLTGGAVHACDHTNASRTGLMNLRQAAWDNDLLEIFGVPSVALPSLQPSSGHFGECTHAALRGVPIVAAIGDSHAALAGHGGAYVKATYGTGTSLMTCSSDVPASERLVGTIAWSTADSIQYGLEGNISMSGSALAWVGEFLGVGLDEVLRLAASVPDAGGVCFVPAMSGLGAPHWDANARGLLCGLENNSRAAHMASAAVEAVTFQVRDVLDLMHIPADAPLCTDGGATRNAALMQLQADVIGRPVLRSACEDLSALGAAWLGGLTLGWWKSVSDFAALPAEPVRFNPQPFDEERYTRWRIAVRRAMLGERHDA